MSAFQTGVILLSLAYCYALLLIQFYKTQVVSTPRPYVSSLSRKELKAEVEHAERRTNAWLDNYTKSVARNNELMATMIDRMESLRVADTTKPGVAEQGD